MAGAPKSPKASPKASPRAVTPKKELPARSFKHSDNAVKLSDGRSFCPALLGGVLSAHKPALCAGGSRIFAPCGNSVLGFSAKSGRRLGTLGPHRGHATAVCSGSSRGDCADPVATGSSFGEVRLWDGRSCACLATLELGSPVQALSWPEPATILVVLGAAGGAVTVETIDVPSLEGARHVSRLPLTAKRFGGFDAHGDIAALIDGTDLCVWVKGWATCRRYAHSCDLTSVAVDPFRRYVAVGDMRGVVWTWWGVLEGSTSEDKVPRVPARWHWHANPVRTLAHCGPALLSGGDEGVLCIRGMEDESLHFIPRFAASFRHIAVAAGGKFVCCSLDDNSLALLDELAGWVRPRYIQALDTSLSNGSKAAWGDQVKSDKFQGEIDQAKKAGSSLARPVLHSLASGGLAVTASGRRVQFFDASGRALPGRPTSLERGGGVNSDPMLSWGLQQIAFSANALCLMTVENRLSPALQAFDPESANNCWLRWWRRTEGGQYVPDSVANNPHSANVTAALAHPYQENRFATVSEDGFFKIWDLLPIAGLAGADGKIDESLTATMTTHCWQQIASGSWRSRPMLCGCFGADGSALATGVPGFVLLWDAEEGKPLQQLALEAWLDKPEQLCSVVACERFLLLASVRGKGKEEVLVWDLASLEIVARVDLGAMLKGTARCAIRCVAPATGSAGGLRLAAFRQSEPEIMVWNLSAGATPSDPPSFTEEVSAALHHSHGVMDVAFVGKGGGSEKPHLCCWTADLELWDLDLAAEGKTVQEETNQLEEEPGTPGRGGALSGLIGGRAAVPGSAAGGGPPRLLKLPLRTTAAQQAGLIPRLVHRVLPPHVPSHMLPPPAMIWAGMISVFAKPAEGVYQAVPAAAATSLVDPTVVKASGAAQPQDAPFLPPWVRQSLAAQPVKPEIVDADWMDELVKGAMSKTKESS